MAQAVLIDMPNYEYQCTECEHVFEQLHSIDQRHAPKDKPCPNCKKRGTVDMKFSNSQIVAGVTVKDQRPDGFRDVLRHIKKHHPLGVIDP